MTVQLVRNLIHSPTDNCPLCRELPEAKDPNVSWWGHRSAQDTTQIIHDVCLSCLQNMAQHRDSLKCPLCQLKYAAFPPEAYQISLQKTAGIFLLHNVDKIQTYVRALVVMAVGVAAAEAMASGESVPRSLSRAFGGAFGGVFGGVIAGGFGEALGAPFGGVFRGNVCEVFQVVMPAVLFGLFFGSATFSMSSEISSENPVIRVAEGSIVEEFTREIISALLAIGAISILGTGCLQAAHFTGSLASRAATNLGVRLIDSSEALEAPLTREEISQGMAQIRENARGFRAEAATRLNQSNNQSRRIS